MLKIGERKISLKEIKPILFTTFKSTNTARPEYLYLKNVEYGKLKLVKIGKISK